MLSMRALPPRTATETRFRPRLAASLALWLALATVLAALAAPRSALASDVLARIESDGSQSQGRWQVFDVQVPRDTDVTITATWTGTGDVNLFLREDGATVAHANGDAIPEQIRHTVTAGSYEIAVLVKTGAASYVVDVTAPSVAPSGDTITSSGDQQTGRWQVFPLDVDRDGTLSASVTWSGGGDVRLFLLDGRGTIAYVTSGSQPRVLAHPVLRGGDYRLAVLVKTGAASYRVQVAVRAGESPGDPPEPEPAPSTTSGYPGRPPQGQVLWGAAVGGNSDPVARHERPAGHPLAIHLTYYQWRHRTGYMIDTARDDLANGRLPWLLIKPPSWDDVAAGRHDREIDQMITALRSLGGPVWLTVHHEPAGGGGVNRPDDPAGPSGHVAMNRRIRQRIDALGARNVALGPVFMYWTWDERSQRDIEQWWAPGIYDFVGVTTYRTNESSLLFGTWYRIRAWAREKGVDVGVAEWGMRGTDAAAGLRVQEWYDHAADSHRDGRGARVVAQVAFDSGLNAPSGSWELRGAQLEAFRSLLRDPRTADVVD